MVVDGKARQVEIVDTASTQYNPLDMGYNVNNGFFLTYSVTKLKTLQELEWIIGEIERFRERPLVCTGNWLA